MGCCLPVNSLSPDLKKLVVELFKEIDSDGNNVIDLQEAMKYWKHNFASLNSRELLKAVDKDGNSLIELKEWIQFWIDVKNSGVKEEDIKEELENLRNKGSWVHFSGL
jgi:Ca2+-binding EF-hand superfamily protein